MQATELALALLWVKGNFLKGYQGLTNLLGDRRARLGNVRNQGQGAVFKDCAAGTKAKAT